jgi:hypothetical protein
MYVTGLYLGAGNICLALKYTFKVTNLVNSIYCDSRRSKELVFEAYK